VLYWLSTMGWTDVVLLERAALTSGSTFHSAGLVGQLRGSLSLTRMMMRCVELYRQLGHETGLSTGWREVGSLRLASSPERMEELRRQAGWARSFGLPFELLSVEEAGRLFPPMSTEGVQGAAYIASDGYVDPSQLTLALVEGARRRGAEVRTEVRVTGIDVERGRVRGVRLRSERIEAPLVVDAGGIFAAEIGAMAGVHVPVVPMEHQYMVTKPARIPVDLPTMRDPSLLVYFPAPDGEFVLGPTPVEGFWVAAGFCAHGLAGAGGMGRLVAEWIVEGAPAFDVWEMDSRRFGPHHAARTYRVARTVEVYSTYYDVRYPHHERRAGRPLRLSPLYARLDRLGAAWGEKAGWEGANWFESNAAEGEESLRPDGWAGRIWSPAIGAEHAACRERVALFDQTSFGKIEVSGSGAEAFLQRLCANDVAVPPGTVVYTQMLNARGGIESDVTVTRLEEDRYRIVTGTALAGHDLWWLEMHRRAGLIDGTVEVRDATSAYACLCVWGPRAREVVQPLTDADLSTEAFPYLQARDVVIGTVPCLAAGVTYVGELGWELYAPVEYGVRLWDTLWEAGGAAGVVAGGYRAIDSLRLEKGYRTWGADITPDDDPYQAGLGFAVKLDKDAEFVGRAALEAAKARPLERTLCCLVLAEPKVMVLGSEPVRVDGRVAGRVTSGGFGYTVGRSIAYAYLPPELATAGWSVEVVDLFGRWVPATVCCAPLYDPEGSRVRA
jgi:glycine cleavage system T protein